MLLCSNPSLIDSSPNPFLRKYLARYPRAKTIFISDMAQRYASGATLGATWLCSPKQFVVNIVAVRSLISDFCHGTNR